ncbi:DMT family transporter [Rhodovulum sp. DZ06]|uniref:DMT family transporter n=1 Tax=Rhodovulum sp. DZ06 TaxID=3425126 RepID=UPI003D33E741
MSTPLRGILFKLVSVSAAASMAACIKAASEGVPAPEAVFFRSLFALPPLLLFYAWRGELRRGFRVHSWRAHLLRGAVGVTAMGLTFTSVILLPLPEATAITFAAPLFTTLLAAPLLGERLRLYRLAAVLAGLVGVAIVTGPQLSLGAAGSSEHLWGVAAALGAALFMALAQLTVRGMTKTETSSAIVLWFTISCCGYAALSAPLWAMPSAKEWGLLLMAGVLGGVAQAGLTEAYRSAEASLIAPFDYASLIFAAAIGYVVFSDVPAWTTAAGSAVTVAAGIAVIRRERQLGLKRGAARPLLAPKR